MNINTDIWQPILQQSTPIAIRALSVTSKILNKATAIFKIDLVLGNKDMILKTNHGKEHKIFDERIINQIVDKNRSLDEKISALKTYMDDGLFKGRRVLREAASSLCEEYSTLEFLLKLCPNLNSIEDCYAPTLFFLVNTVYFKETATKMLIDAGADWRIENPHGNIIFDTREFPTYITLEGKIRYEKLIAYAQGYWKQLNRENTPVPSRTFTIHTQQLSTHDLFYTY